MTFFRRLLKEKAFTLIELMVVVIIVGILAAVAVPIHRKNVGRAAASEGKALVGSVRTAERVYYCEHNTYTANLSDLDGIDYADNRCFDIAPTIVCSDATHFIVTVTGSGQSSCITVTLDESGNLTVTIE